MTVIQPNSITGINSITVQSGQALNIHDANGNIIRNITSSSGVSTFSSLHIGSGTTTSTHGISVGTGCSIISRTVNDLEFYTNGSQKVVIKSGGGVGINESSPTGKLTVTQDPQGFPSDSAQPNATLLIKHGTSGSNRRWIGIGASLTGAWIQSSSPGGSGLAAPLWINKGGGEVRFGSNGTKVFIKQASAAAIGIGTDAPTAASSENTLHVFAPEYPEVHLTSAVTGSNASDGSIFTLNNDSSTIIRNQENSYIRFDTNGSNERLRIAANGALGIGGANYGTSGHVLTSGGSGAAPSWAAAGGITMAEHWRLTGDVQGNADPLGSWEAADNGFAGNLGSSMSHSGGTFTYPSTGIYYVMFTLVGYSDNHTQNVIGFMKHTTNNSSYSEVAYGLNGIYDYNNSYPSWATATCHYIFDITDTSQQKTRFCYGAGQGGEYAKGSSTVSYTSVTFIRLGDT